MGMNEPSETASINGIGELMGKYPTLSHRGGQNHVVQRLQKFPHGWSLVTRELVTFPLLRQKDHDQSSLQNVELQFATDKKEFISILAGKHGSLQRDGWNSKLRAHILSRKHKSLVTFLLRRSHFLKPLQIASPTGDHVLKILRLWEHCSFKPHPQWQLAW